LVLLRACFDRVVVAVDGAASGASLGRHSSDGGRRAAPGQAATWRAFDPGMPLPSRLAGDCVRVPSSVL
jgi:hypothetical protein